MSDAIGLRRAYDAVRLTTSQEQIRAVVEAAQDATRRGAYRDAVSHYRQLVELAPLGACFNNLGLALSRDGQLREAVTAFRRAIESEPSAAAWVNLGNARRRLGQKRPAIDAYQAALVLEPDAAHAHFNMHAALYDEAAPDSAMSSLERALALRPEHLDTRFYLGALRTLHGGDSHVVDGLPDACDFLVSSLRYVEKQRGRQDTRAAKLFADTFDTLKFAFAESHASGAVVELGVRRGTTVRLLGELNAPAVVHGFDAFEGLPQEWGDQAPGLYTTGGEMPDVPANVTLHQGWFADTLPKFAATLEEPLRFLHVDCDLYSSTRDAFDCLAPFLVEGTVILFDEYLCNPGWQDEEFRAFQETGIAYEYLAFSLFTKQAAVIVKAPKR